MLNAGTPAPDFTVLDHESTSRSLKEFKGKKVVLWFYPEADTPGCTAEGCAFRDLKAEYEQKNAAILGVSFNTPEQNKAFAQKYHFTFPLLSDVERKLGVAYGAADDATAKNARRIGVIIDGDGKVTHYFPKVSAKDFPFEALKLL